MGARVYRESDATNPVHYRTESGRECIDDQREEYGDLGFLAHCLQCAYKYRYRLGKKGPVEIDEGKARWYDQMAVHVLLPKRYPDPRDELVEVFSGDVLSAKRLVKERGAL